MLYLLFLMFGLASGTFTRRTELDKYTRLAKTTDGSPCLGGCSQATNDCVVNWQWVKKPCVLENEVAPIFYASQVGKSNNKICLSNCGKFGYVHEWCITTADNEWDYCSSQVRGKASNTGRSFVESYTRDKIPCQTECINKKGKGYTCHINNIIWRYCAKPASSRVPTLPEDFKIGDYKKHNCEAFLTNLVEKSLKANVSYYDAEYAPDNFLQEVAEDIEMAVKLASESGLTKETRGPGNAVNNYTMVNMILANGTSVLVPAVIQAVISKSTIRQNQPLIDLRMMTERNGSNRRRRQLDENNGYFNWRIIGYELGGSDQDYNFIRQSPNLYDSWLNLQRAFSKWCSNTGGSVKVLVVVFYPDVQTILPKAIGASMTFLNPDGSTFVDCKDTIFWNK